MYVTLAAVHVLPDWLAILVVFRDLVIVGGVVVLSLLGQPVAIRPLYVSKLNTALQIVLVASRCCWPVSGWPRRSLMASLIWAVAGDHAGLRRRLCLDHGRRDDDQDLPARARTDRRSAAAPALVRPRPPPVTAGQATRGQRVALLVGLLVVAWLALQLFASVLAAVRRRRRASPMCSIRRPRG